MQTPQLSIFATASSCQVLRYWRLMDPLGAVFRYRYPRGTDIQIHLIDFWAHLQVPIKALAWPDEYKQSGDRGILMETVLRRRAKSHRRTKQGYSRWEFLARRVSGFDRTYSFIGRRPQLILSFRCFPSDTSDGDGHDALESACAAAPQIQHRRQHFYDHMAVCLLDFRYHSAVATTEIFSNMVRV